MTIPELAMAGAFSAIPATLVAGPAERVKVLLQVRRPSSPVSFIRLFKLNQGNRSQVKVVPPPTQDLWMSYVNFMLKEESGRFSEVLERH